MTPQIAQHSELPQHFLGVGEGSLFTEPTQSNTVLGSCVAVTFFWPRMQMGAIVHALMPAWRDYETRMTEEVRFKFVDSAIEGMYENLLDRGARIAELECKVFGGASTLGLARLSVAPQNVRTAFDTLSRLGLRVAASHVGGVKGRRLVFLSHTGDVFIKALQGLE